MNYSVTVLLENGRRQRLPVKPNTPFLVILEEVCKKHGLKADDFDLKYHQRILDLASTVQFGNVSNNAQLELVPVTKTRIESDVKIFLQLESGERVSGSFLPSCSLSHVINTLCGDDIKAMENPVIIFTRQEVTGERLNETTLKMLGLTHGNALLRLLHRTEDQLKNQSSACVYNLPLKSKKEEPELRRLKEGSLKDFEEIKPQVENKEHSFCDNLKDAFKPRTSSEAAEDSFQNEIAGSSILQQKIIDDKMVFSKPSETKTIKQIESLNLNKIKFLGERKALVFCIDDVQSSKFDDQSDDFYDLTIDDAKKLLRDIKRTRSELEEAQLETSESKARKKSSLLDRAVSIYPNCVVRVLFPNRFALQGVFQSTDSVAAVNQFVKNFLHDPTCDFYLYLAPPKSIPDPSQLLIEIGGVPGLNFYFGGKWKENNSEGPFLHQNFIDNAVPAELALRVANHFRQRFDNVVQENPEPSLSPIENRFEMSGNESSLNQSPQSERRNFDPKLSVSGGPVPKWFKPK